MSEAHGEIGRALNESNERWARHVHEVVEELTEKHRTKIALLERPQAEAAKAIRAYQDAARQVCPTFDAKASASTRWAAMFAEIEREHAAAIQRAREQT